MRDALQCGIEPDESCRHGLAFCLYPQLMDSLQIVWVASQTSRQRPRLQDPQVEFHREIYGVAGTAIAFLVLQMLLCGIVTLQMKRRNGFTAEALRRASGIAPPSLFPA